MENVSFEWMMVELRRRSQNIVDSVDKQREFGVSEDDITYRLPEMMFSIECLLQDMRDMDKTIRCKEVTE